MSSLSSRCSTPSRSRFGSPPPTRSRTPGQRYRTGSSGDLPAIASPMAVPPIAYPMAIGPWDALTVAPRSRAIPTVPAIDHVVSLDAIFLDGAEWMRSTKAIADEVVQCFGIDEVPQIRPMENSGPLGWV